MNVAMRGTLDGNSNQVPRAVEESALQVTGTPGPARSKEPIHSHECQHHKNRNHDILHGTRSGEIPTPGMLFGGA
jgi:hypothetical protein